MSQPPILSFPLLVPLLLAVVVHFVPPPLASLAASPEGVVDRLQASYQGIEDLEAKFVQRSTNRSIGQTLEASGEVAMKKPGKVRWQYQSPEPRLIVSDGRTLWIYSPEDKQVIVQEAVDAFSLTSLSFLAGIGNLRSDFHIRPITHAGTRGLRQHLLELVPKKPAAGFTKMIVEVDPETFLIEKATLFDAYANMTSIVLEGLKINTSLPDSLFVFTPPPGVEIIKATQPIGR